MSRLFFAAKKCCPALDSLDSRNGHAPLKLILCGNIQGTENDKVGVVSVVYATNDKDLAEQKMNELIAVNPNNYYMVYSVPLNVDLTELSHYPSIAISKDDL